MELDKRIMSGKKPLDCFDIDKAEQFIGKKGYVTDFLQDFCNLNKVKTSKLKTVLHTELCCYLCGSTGKKYFLPAEWVKEPEKKYRPYTLAEWIEKHEIGDVIKFRNSHNQEFHVMYSGYIFDTNDDTQDIRTKGQIMFVTSAYSFQELFDNYEICINGEWHPFGVEE